MYVGQEVSPVNCDLFDPLSITRLKEIWVAKIYFSRWATGVFEEAHIHGGSGWEGSRFTLGGAEC